MLFTDAAINSSWVGDSVPSWHTKIWPQLFTTLSLFSGTKTGQYTWSWSLQNLGNSTYYRILRWISLATWTIMSTWNMTSSLSTLASHNLLIQIQGLGPLPKITKRSPKALVWLTAILLWHNGTLHSKYKLQQYGRQNCLGGLVWDWGMNSHRN